MSGPLSKEELQHRLRTKGMPTHGNMVTLRARLAMATPVTDNHTQAPPPPPHSILETNSAPLSPSVHLYPSAELPSNIRLEHATAPPPPPLETTATETNMIAITLERGKTFKFDPTCLGDEVEIVDKIGSGAFGAAFVACMVDHCDYVLKLVPLGSAYSYRDDFVKEAALTKIMSDAGIGAKLYKSFICNGAHEVGVLLLERWDGNMTPEDLAQVAQNQHLQNILAELVMKLHMLGYLHLDLKPKNVLVRRRLGIVTDIRLTDWGLTEPRNEPLSNIRLMQLYNYHAKRGYTQIGLEGIPYERFIADPRLFDYGLLFYFQRASHF